MNNIDRILETIDQGLETPHERHVRILRDISALALLEAGKPNNFDYSDAVETIAICESWVESQPTEQGQTSETFYD